MSAQPQVTGSLGFQTIFIGACQKVNFNSVSQIVASFVTGTATVRLFATKDCFIKIGTSPVADNAGTSMILPAGIIDTIGIKTFEMLAVIRSSDDGVLYITAGL